MKSIKSKLIQILMTAAILFGAGAANAVTQLNLTCIPPITRVDGTALSSVELGPYTFFLDGAQIGTSNTCTLIHPIAKGSTVKKSQVFTVMATDKNGNPSPLSMGVSLSSDASNPFSPPSAPAGLRIITGE